MKLRGKEAIDFLAARGMPADEVAFLIGEWRLGVEVELDVFEGRDGELNPKRAQFDGGCAPSMTFDLPLDIGPYGRKGNV